MQFFRRRFKFIWVCFFCVYLFYGGYMLYLFYVSRHHVSIHWDPVEYNNDKQLSINTKGCSVPIGNPFHSSIMSFIKSPTKEKKLPYTFSLLAQNDTHLWIVEDNKKYYRNSTDPVHCCYKTFRHKNSEGVISYNSCINFTLAIEVNQDYFVKLLCYANQSKIFENVYLFPHSKIFNVLKEAETFKPLFKSYNVLVIGLKNISQANFFRNMARTSITISDRLNAIELFGYSNVRDKVERLLISSQKNKKCLPEVDDCSLVWQIYKQEGFITALMSSDISLGLSSDQDTPDHHFSPFLHETVKFEKNHTTVAVKPVHEIFLQYIIDLMKSADKSSNKIFGYFWHPTPMVDLNSPLIIDKSYMAFLNELKTSGYLDRTVLFFISDQGLGNICILESEQGRLEHRKPFAYVLVPEIFQKEYPAAYKNLRINSGRLTTPYDIHETLLDLVNMENKQRHSSGRGISLFSEIPSTRTCEQAGISDYWCPCYAETKISLKDTRVRFMSQIALEYLNAMLSKEVVCKELNIDRTLELKVRRLKFESEWYEYMIVVLTKPGGAVFRCGLRKGTFGSWYVSTPFARLDMYVTPECLLNRNSFLEMFCFCVDQPTQNDIKKNE